MNLQALNDNVLVEVFDSEKKTAGGLFIPQTAQHKKDKGVIISVGETVKDSRVKVGVIAHAVKGAFLKNTYEEDGKTYSVVKDYDLQLFES